jgi:Eco57I restriction-modification methylase
MLPGFAGHLLSEEFLESLPSSGAWFAGRGEQARRRLTAWRRRCLDLGPVSSLRAMFDAGVCPLVAALGFEPPLDLHHVDGVLAATLRRASHRAALLTIGWGHPIDPVWRAAVTESLSRSAPWCLVFNGTHLRVVDAGRPYARRHAQFDLDLALDDEEVFAVFWRLFAAETIAGGADPPATALHALVADSDRHAARVCESLREGVFDAAREMTTALLVHRRPPADPSRLDGAFEQSLTIIYRLLFLLFAEARGLLPTWHPIYRTSYSMDALCDLASRAGPARGLWSAMQAMARLAHAGCRAGDLRVTAFNGRLFAPVHAPLAERRQVDDEAARRAVLALSTRGTPGLGGRRRIGYRDLGVEQLGAVYESLLDYRPRLARGGVELGAGSRLRKATGTFYTPQPIADYLVRRTLEPLVRDATPDRILSLRIVDPAMGSGAFLVAACRYLAAEYEQALARSGGCRASDIDDRDRATIRRTIAERCLYGVDLNPTAVQLARLSLWLATLAAHRPLTFLDHRLLSGDSLVGAWLQNLAGPPGRWRRTRQPTRPTLFEEDEVQAALAAALPIRFSLEGEPGDTIDRVRQKERALARLHRHDHALEKWRRVADLWCASWFAPREIPASAFVTLTDLILRGRCALPARLSSRVLEHGARVAASRRFFHWEIEFPEVFFGAGGERLAAPGFDAVIGNPPWDMMRADAGDANERARTREEATRLLRFTRDSGLYTASSRGHPNRYQLFAERAIELTRAGGRIGLVVPSGLAGDLGSAPLRRRLLARCAVDALIGFDNRDGVFPIHRSTRFLLLTASAGQPTTSVACRFGEHDPAVLERSFDAAGDDRRPLHLTVSLIRALSGDTLAIPDLRSPLDVAILERTAALFPRLESPEGWHVRFGRELNATEDRRHFCPAGHGLPIVEGKQIEPFRTRLDASRHSVDPGRAGALLPRRGFERERLAYRDVAGATNRLTLIAAVLPPACVTTHTVFCLRERLPSDRQHVLCGLFNSFVLNYLVRLRVSTHVTAAIVQALPVPAPRGHPAALGRIGTLARLLARGPDDDAYCRLQAEVAALYRLDTTELAHVLGTFPLIEEKIRWRVLDIFTAEARK